MGEIDKKTLENELRAIVSEITEVEPEKITLQAKFVEDLGMDSMMALEILASIEKKYKLKIPEEYLGKISTLSGLMEIAEEFIKEKE
ncbi:MAG: acyl carrier protein [Candidatus Omnitrophota bacterium]|nr:acyl carrier protein [Candidatus Omnitrophota bacterium]